MRDDKNLFNFTETQTGEQSQSNRPDAEGDVTLTIDKSTTNAGTTLWSLKTVKR